MPTILFYPTNGHGGSHNKAENDERYEHLEKSMSEILNHFYPSQKNKENREQETEKAKNKKQRK